MLEGKFAVVTGANRGIGEAIARLFAKNNANLFLVAREISNVENIASIAFFILGLSFLYSDDFLCSSFSLTV